MHDVNGLFGILYRFSRWTITIARESANEIIVSLYALIPEVKYHGDIHGSDVIIGNCQMYTRETLSPVPAVRYTTHVHTYMYMNSHPEYMRALRSVAWAACVSVTWKPIDNGVRVRENKEGSPHMSLRPSFLDVNGLSRWPMERKLILVVCLQAVFMNVRGI